MLERHRFLLGRDPALRGRRGLCGSFRQSARLRRGLYFLHHGRGRLLKHSSDEKPDEKMKQELRRRKRGKQQKSSSVRSGKSNGAAAVAPWLSVISYRLSVIGLVKRNGMRLCKGQRVRIFSLFISDVS